MTISWRQHSVVYWVAGWAAISIALSGSAFAQIKPKLNLLNEEKKDRGNEAYRKALENEYQSKLKTIPDQPQKKADPWANVRSSNPSAK